MAAAVEGVLADLNDDPGQELWVRTQPNGQAYLSINWKKEIADNCQLMDPIEREGASRWEMLARQLTLGAHSAQRAFDGHDIARFSERRDNITRCRYMLAEWLQMSLNHNVGALYKAMHRSGLGALADRVLATRVGVMEETTLSVENSSEETNLTVAVTGKYHSKLREITIYC